MWFRVGKESPDGSDENISIRLRVYKNRFLADRDCPESASQHSQTELGGEQTENKIRPGWPWENVG